MGMIDAVYLFTPQLKIKATITKGISELIHAEAGHTLTAEIPDKHGAMNGDYIGFTGIDGKFLLFEIDMTETNDETRTTLHMCTDAGAAALSGMVCPPIKMEYATVREAVEAALEGSGCTVGEDDSWEDTLEIKLPYTTRWKALAGFAHDYGVRIIPRYEMREDGTIKGTVDIQRRTSKFRGIFVEKDTDSSGVSITFSGAPRPAVYPIGGEDADGKQLTIEDVEWVKDQNGPVDKPLGQAWIGVPEAVNQYPGREQIIEFVNCDDVNRLIQLGWERAQRAAQQEMSASATVSDMEMAAGQTWKKIRLYDLAGVRTKSGLQAEKTIIEIERNYVRPDLTKVTLGEEDEPPEDIRRQMADASAMAKAAARGGGGAGKAAERNYLLLEANDIRVSEVETEISSIYIELDAVNNALTLKADLSMLEGTNSILNETMIRLDSAEAAIIERATVTEVTRLGERVSTAELILNGDPGSADIGLVTRVKQAELEIDENGQKIGEVELKTDELGETILSLESTMTEADARIETRVKAVEDENTTQSEAVAALRSDLDSSVASIGTRMEKVEGDTVTQSAAIVALRSDLDSSVASLSAKVDDNEASITATATQLGSRIDLKADKTYVEDLIAEEIEAAIADINLGISETVVTAYLTVTGRATLSAMALGGENVTKTTLPIVTSFTQALGESAPTQEYTLLTCA